ncbi:B12-binding domain-containing radical SAM protein [Planctomycetota bacterium]
MKMSFIIHDYHQNRNSFPMGPAYLAAVLREKGHDIHIYNMAVYHYTIEEMVDFYKNNHFDAIGIGFICGYYSYKQVVRVCEALNTIKDRPPIILGGHGPAPEPEYFLRKLEADFVSLGEAELTLPILLEAIANKKSYSEVPGFGYRIEDSVYLNEKSEPVQDLDTIPFPAWDLFPMESYISNHAEPSKPTDRFGNIFSSRGCPYTCNFCYRMEKSIRLRSVDKVMEEMAMLMDRYNINYFQFQDELCMVNEKRIFEICDGIEKNNFKIEFYLNGRLNIVNKAMLKRLKEVGCRFINYGIESADEEVLRLMNKKLDLEQIHRGLQITIEAGIEPGVNILFGNIGDTHESFEKSFTLLKQYDTFCQNRTIKPVTPFPGTPLYDYAIEKGLIKDADDFYKKHVNSDRLTVNFSNVSDDEAYKMLFNANSELIREYHKRKAESHIGGLHKLLFEGEYDFRGVR